MMSFQQILTYAVKNGASDIHLTVGSPPALRIDGNIRFIGDESLKARDTMAFLSEVMTPEQKEQFMKTGDADLALGVSGLGRFRVNVLRQRGSVGMVLRHVRGKILDFEDLNLPPVLRDIADMRRGLVLITGTTASGKSTTLASMIDRINQTRPVHVITLEDPIEFLHRNKKAIVTQREVSIDTRDFKVA
ncbi:MAG TPA: type IV pili twitching motility protein PilT, partial [Candidatus Hydrogenedentes bacterium]|nr:type IV pili twitching motility protein PilT [Candidatus Hydrogenedentota bacterium]